MSGAPARHLEQKVGKRLIASGRERAVFRYVSFAICVCTVGLLLDTHATQHSFRRHTTTNNNVVHAERRDAPRAGSVPPPFVVTLPSVAPPSTGEVARATLDPPPARPPTSALPTCPRNTAVHAAVRLAAAQGPAPPHPACARERRASNNITELPVLAGWGLAPLPHSPLPPACEGDDTPWRGGGVEVRADAGVPSTRLPAGYGRTRRLEHDVRARADWHHACLRVRGPRGTAHCVAGGLPLDDLPRAPLRDVSQALRSALRQHGFTVNAAVKNWMQRTAAKYRDGGAGGTHHPYGFPTFSTDFHAGPWIEDYWVATFARPVVQTVPFTDEWRVQAQSPWLPRVLNHTTGVPQDAAVAVAPHADPVTGAAVVDVEFPYDAELFHPWVPLFVPWDNMMHALSGKSSLATELCAFGDVLVSVLDPSVAYVTVVQRPSGPWLGTRRTTQDVAGLKAAGCPHKFLDVLKNTLVISAGGTGHVPIPLLASERPFLQCSADPAPGVDRRTHDVTFLGSSREGTRSAALDLLRSSEGWGKYVATDLQLLQALLDPGSGGALLRSYGLVASDVGLPNTSSVDGSHHATPVMTAASSLPRGGAYDYAWIRAMAGSAFQFAPRGAGPTSFRLYEALQMGLLPVYVHDGAPWLPYLKRGESVEWVAGKPEGEQSLWARIALLVNVPDLPFWLRSHATYSTIGLWTMRDLQADKGLRFDALRVAAARVRDRLFTHDGVIRRLAEFLDDPSSAELDCQGSSYVDL